MSPGPPKAVQVGPYRYTVKVDGDAVAAFSRTTQRRASGYSDHEAQAIYLHPDLGPDARAETLLHECLHAILCGPVLSAQDLEEDERLITELGYALLDLLRRNPELVAYLTKGGSHG